MLKNMKEKNADLISILMPTYNVAPYVEEAVKSILHQTYQHLELIIVDDCSTDGTYEILQKISQTDSRIKLKRNDVNCKICITLNRALKEAEGAYIGRMDGDDVSEPDRFAVLKNNLDEHPEVDLVGSQLISIDESGQILSMKKYLRSPAFIRLGNRTSSCVPHAWLARRTVYENLDGYRNIPFAEDYDFLLRGEKEGFCYANVKRYLYQVRIRQGNTGSTNGLKQIKLKYYVQDINSSRIPYVEETYQKALTCTISEQKSFLKAHKHLTTAVKSRKKPCKLIYHVLAGCLQSKYVFKYLLETIWVRILIFVEDLCIPRKYD